MPLLFTADGRQKTRPSFYSHYPGGETIMKVRIIAGALAALSIWAGGTMAAEVNDKPFEEGWWPTVEGRE